MRPRHTPDGVRRRAWALPWQWRVKRLWPVQLVAFAVGELGEELREVGS